MDWIVDFIAKYWWVVILIIVVGLFLRARPSSGSDDRKDDDGQPQALPAPRKREKENAAAPLREPRRLQLLP